MTLSIFAWFLFQGYRKMRYSVFNHFKFRFHRSWSESWKGSVICNIILLLRSVFDFRLITRHTWVIIQFNHVSKFPYRHNLHSIRLSSLICRIILLLGSVSNSRLIIRQTRFIIPEIYSNILGIVYLKSQRFNPNWRFEIFGAEAGGGADSFFDVLARITAAFLNQFQNEFF